MRHLPPADKAALSPRLSRLTPRALALLDVLIGMAIFALIAVIAVIVVGQFRQRAFVTGAISDARSVGLSIEAAATQSGEFPGTVAADGTGDRAITATVAAADKKLGVITPGNRIGGYAYLPATAADGSGFRVCVEHVENGAVSASGATADAHAVYDSVKGGVIASGGGPCAAALAALPGGATGEPPEDPSEEPPATVDWTGYPSDLGDYGPADSIRPCPTLHGLESDWTEFTDSVMIYATFTETETEALARTGVSSDWALRVVDSTTGVATAWQYSGYVDGRPKMKRFSAGSSLVEGRPYYVEVSAWNRFDRIRSPKCTTVGKFVMKKIENRRTGTVQSIDGAAVPGGFTPTYAKAACPQISNVTWHRDRFAGYVSFRRDAMLTGYTWRWKRPNGGGDGWSSPMDLSVDPTIGRASVPVNDPDGTTYTILLQVTDEATGARSEDCTIAAQATRPMGSVRGTVYPGAVVTVDPYW